MVDAATTTVSRHEHPGRPARTWLLGGPSTIRRPVSGRRSVADTSPHWVMAIVALIFFFPVGIPAVIFASRARTSVQTGDMERARKSASLVKILFWVTVALVVIAVLSRL